MLKLPLTIILLASGVLGWKPIISPASFSISQHHPALGQSHNTILDSVDTSATASGGTVTYHGNSFLNSHAHGHELVDSDEHAGGDSEARVVTSGSTGYSYGPKFLTGLLPSTTVS